MQRKSRSCGLYRPLSRRSRRYFGFAAPDSRLFHVDCGMSGTGICSVAANLYHEEMSSMTTLYFLRHGIAEDPRPGQSDGDRELTPEGRENMLLEAAAI